MAAALFSYNSQCISDKSLQVTSVLGAVPTFCYWGDAVNESPVEGRVIQLFMYMRSHPDDNHYVRIHPLHCLFLGQFCLELGPVWPMCCPIHSQHDGAVSRMMYLPQQNPNE